jgi:acetolactate synthase-1/2/3 large subunit
MSVMNGADSLVETLLAGGVEVCFTNPGTSEMHIVAALDRRQKMRCVLGLFEGVATAAADGYARMAGKPACTLLHLGPGLANGLANLHNARRARVPIVNLVGQHSLEHLGTDTPLNSDIEAIAKPFSAWLRTSRAVSDLGCDVAAAIAASRMPPGQIATLIVPADVAWVAGGKPAAVLPIPVAQIPSAQVVDQAASMLRSGLPSALLLGGNALYGPGLLAAGRIAKATGARLLAPYPFTRIERGAGRPVVDRVPYVRQQARDLLKDFRQLILVGAEEPLAYFASPETDSKLIPPGSEIFTLAKPEEDAAATLEALSASLGSDVSQGSQEPAFQPPLPSGAITQEGVASVIAALLPENAIVVDESMTTGRGIMSAARGAPPHDWLANTGGSIGIALPLAVGAAVACKDRPVLCLSADGSGMYTPQALWTMARENLRIVTVIFANRAYAVLRREFLNLGVGDPGTTASALFAIGSPDLDWVSLAKGMGVPAFRASSQETFASLLRAAFESEGPVLLELPL